MTMASRTIPYLAPCIQAVCPVPMNAARTPRADSSSASMSAVVLFPIAESVPTTTTLRESTESISPL